MSTSAAKEKERGNAAFKAGQYAEAVGHYSAAIIADRTDPTLPLNRAAAYLKLGKNEDAERDCTIVLNLPTSKTNVKALFRRSQARSALGKLSEAESDLREAIRLEPTNEAVRTELDKLPLSKPTTSHPATQQRPYRRRVPITVVDGPAATSSPGASSSSISSAAIMSAVSSRSIRADTDTPKPAPPQRDPFETRTVYGHKVGGGIFKKPKPPPSEASKPETLASKTKAESAMTEVKAPLTNSAPFDVIPLSPTKALPTLFDFTRAWNHAQSTVQQWSLIQDVPPSSLPTLFRSSLEPPLLISILQTFLQVLSNCSDAARSLVKDYMTSFPNVPRFDFVIMFLSVKEKHLVKDVWTSLRVEGEAPGWS